MMHKMELEIIADTIRQLPLADERKTMVALRFADAFHLVHRPHFWNDRWLFLQRCGCLKAVLEASLKEPQS